MNHSWWVPRLLLVAAMCGLIWTMLGKEPPRTMEEVKAVLDGDGLHCILVERGGSSTLVVSDRPFDPDPDFGFQWQYTTGWDKGKVLVFSHRVLDYPSTRTASWGWVSATGDDVLLNRIGKLLD